MQGGELATLKRSDIFFTAPMSARNRFVGQSPRPPPQTVRRLPENRRRGSAEPRGHRPGIVLPGPRISPLAAQSVELLKALSPPVEMAL